MAASGVQAALPFHWDTNQQGFAFPFLFSIKTTSLDLFFRLHGFTYCLSPHLSVPQTTVSTQISTCLTDISKWMKECLLQLRLSKTEVLVISASPSLSVQHDINIQLSSAPFSLTKSVRNMGIIIDDLLTFTEYVASVFWSYHFALLYVRSGRSGLIWSMPLFSFLQALVISRLDYF